jgi:hypothetical protein
MTTEEKSIIDVINEAENAIENLRDIKKRGLSKN